MHPWFTKEKIKSNETLNEQQIRAPAGEKQSS